MNLVRQLLALAWITLLIVMATYYLAQSLVSSGPNCPGMDPEWIGRCEDVQ